MIIVLACHAEFQRHFIFIRTVFIAPSLVGELQLHQISFQTPHSTVIASVKITMMQTKSLGEPLRKTIVSEAVAVSRGKAVDVKVMENGKRD